MEMGVPGAISSRQESIQVAIGQLQTQDDVSERIEVVGHRQPF